MGSEFFFGCRCAYTRNVLFGSNSDTAARIMKSNRVTQVLRESVTKDLKTANRKAAKFMRWQFATLIAGAVRLNGIIDYINYVIVCTPRVYKNKKEWKEV